MTSPAASLNIFAYAHGVRRKYSGSAEDIFLNLQYIIYFSLRPPKLVNVKYASRLRTVSMRCYVRQGVKSQRHLNEGAAENIIFTNNIYMGASAEISPRALLGRNDVIYLLGRNDVI